MTMHEAVMQWLAPCPQVQNLFFQFGNSEVDNIILSPSDETVIRYIDGSAIHRYVVQLICFLPVSTDADATNIESMIDIDDLNGWMEEQQEQSNYPAFPSGCTVQEIELIDSGIGYAATENGTIAKYIVPFAITYLKE